jgi:hypothetical protein
MLLLGVPCAVAPLFCTKTVAARVLVDQNVGNGSFESGSVQPWQKGSSQPWKPFDSAVLDVVSDAAFAYDGTHYLRISRGPDPNVPVGVIQLPALDVADGYQIQVMWWARAGAGSRFEGVDIIGPANVFASSWFLTPALEADHWNQYFGNFYMSGEWTGGPTSFGVGFWGRGDGDSPAVGFIDGVTVLQVPEPSAALLLILLPAAAAAASRRANGQHAARAPGSFCSNHGSGKG